MHARAARPPPSDPAPTGPAAGGGRGEVRDVGDRRGSAPAGTPPAVVLGGGITALGATRSLARRGIRVLHLAGPRPGPLARSRWYRPLREDAAPDATGSPEALSRALRDAGPPASVLFPCSDDAVKAVAGLPRELGRRHRSSRPDGATLDLFLSKARLGEALRETGVPHPRTVPLRSREELDRVPEEAFERALVKPVDSQAFFARFGVKAFAATSREEAAAGLERCREAGLAAVLQEWVPGPPTNHVFLDGFRAADGGIRGLLARRRLRMHPPDFGNSSAMVTVEPGEAQGAVDSLVHLLGETGYRGIFSAEYKQDARDGVFRLLEVNVRAWWYVEFAARCGLDVCRMAYEEALGRPVEPAGEIRPGQRCVYPYYDFFAGWREVRGGRLSPTAWLGSWVGARTPVFAWDDPWPAAAGAWERIRGAVGRRLPGAGRRAAA